MANQHPPVTPEVIARWKAALVEGMGYKHVAETFGVSITTVRRHLPGMGWTHRQVIEHGVLIKQHKVKMRKANYV